MSVQHFTVTTEEAGQKLLQYLQRKLGKDIPKGAVMRWIRTGQVRINKGRCKPFDRLAAGDVVRVPPFHSETTIASPVVEEQVIHQSGEGADALSIVGKEKGLLVINKPAGLPVQPGTGHSDAVTTRLRCAYPEAAFAPTPAHRLDKNTSGLLLVATSYERLRSLHEQFADDHAIYKEYLVWVAGIWPYAQPVRLEDHLKKVTTKGGKDRVEVVGENDGGKFSACTVRCIKSGSVNGLPLLAAKEQSDTWKSNESAKFVTAGGGEASPHYSLLSVVLHTGRTHQIRVQLASRGFPIVGDRKYGGKPCSQGMMLHAWRMVVDGSTFTCLPEWKEYFTVTS